MDSAMVSKVEKAMRYAQEKDRIVFSQFAVTIEGDHGPHAISYNKGRWSCDCDFFSRRGVCSHTMTMERVLRGMLPPQWEAEP